MLDTIFLDWSGTLVDDLEAVLAGTNEVFRSFGFPEMSRERFREEFELPVPRFYERVMPGIPFDALDKAFFEGFQRAQSSIRPLDAAEPFLRHASERGVRLRVLTTLDPDNAARQLAQFGWGGFFEEIHAGVLDKVPFLCELVDELGLDRGRTAFVGDLPHDIDAGRAAGLRSCAVLSGYASHDRLAESEPDWILPDVGSLSERLADR